MVTKRFIFALVLLGLLTNMVYSEESEVNAAQCSGDIFRSLFPDNGKYTIQEYTVLTADKVNLKVFRVGLSTEEFHKLPQSLQNNSKRVLWLQHGILDSSDGWFMNKESNSPGFWLVNRGFDVWLGNNRGNKYSHSTTVNKTHKEFFDYSFQDYVQWDIPAFYAHVQAHTSKDTKITWIGHSQGTEQFFAALSDPQTSDFLNANTERFIALAPIVFLGNIESSALQWASRTNGVVGTVAGWIGLDEIAASSCQGATTWTKMIGTICNMWSGICEEAFKLTGQSSEYNSFHQDSEKYLTHHPCGTSMKNYMHLAQAITADVDGPPKFAKYDYGEAGNLEHYGQKEAPEWDLSKIKIPMTLIGGNNDKLARKADVQILISKLGEGLAEQHWLDNWDHVSYLYAKYPEPFLEILKATLKIED